VSKFGQELGEGKCLCIEKATAGVLVTGVLFLSMGMLAIGLAPAWPEFVQCVWVCKHTEGVNGHIDVLKWARELCPMFKLIQWE